jgi:hypothetical protein
MTLQKWIYFPKDPCQFAPPKARKASFERSLQGRVNSVFRISCTEITIFQACEDGALQKIHLDPSVGILEISKSTGTQPERTSRE